MSNSKIKIFITGAAGFLGSHLAEHLAKMGHKIVGVDNMIGGYEDNIPGNIEFHKTDCCDLEKMRELMKDVDVVYHFLLLSNFLFSQFFPYAIMILVIF